MSGRAAASIITAQPPWQLPMTDRLLALRMALGDDADEFGFGVGDIGERLARHRLRKEDDEVDGVAGAQRDADFGVFLEAADARTVPRARVDDHERPLGVVDLDALGRDDAHQRVVGRPLVRRARRRSSRIGS